MRFRGIAALIIATGVAGASGATAGTSQQALRTILFLRASASYTGAPSCPPDWTVMKIDATSGEERAVARLPHLSLPADWSPHSRRLLFWTFDRDCTRLGRLSVLDLATKRTRQLLPVRHQRRALSGAVESPAGIINVLAAWSSDGRTIAAESGVRGRGPGIVLLDPSGRKRPRLIVRTSNVLNLAWAPDSSKILYGRMTVKYSCCGLIFLVDRTGRHDHLVVDGGPAQGVSTLWSPDGRQIAWAVRWFPSPGVRMLNADGSGQTILTRSRDVLSSWSPDGSTIAVTRDDTNVVLVRADGGGERAVATDASEPAWSPDGTDVVYVGGRETSTRHLFLVNRDGTGTRQITYGPRVDSWPQWVR